MAQCTAHQSASWDDLASHINLYTKVTCIPIILYIRSMPSNHLLVAGTPWHVKNSQATMRSHMCGKFLVYETYRWDDNTMKRCRSSNVRTSKRQNVTNKFKAHDIAYCCQMHIEGGYLRGSSKSFCCRTATGCFFFVYGAVHSMTIIDHRASLKQRFNELDVHK